MGNGTQRWLFGLMAALFIFTFSLIGIVLAKALGVVLFDTVLKRFGEAVDKAGITELVLFAILIILGLVIFCLGALLAARSRWLFHFLTGTSRHPATLRVTFGRNVSGCRVTTFRGGSPTIFYRLWVRPGASLPYRNCIGTLVDVMAPTRNVAGSWTSVWEPERLRLCWATHTRNPETRIDVDDEHGQFLDVFFISENGEFGFGCELHPASLSTVSFEVGATYMFVVSLACDGEEPQTVRLTLNWPESWQDESIEMV